MLTAIRGAGLAGVLGGALLVGGCGGQVDGAEAESVDTEGQGVGAGERAVPQEAIGSLSEGDCRATWERMELNNASQRRQWSEPELQVDCETGNQQLTTETLQNGFRQRMQFVFRGGELQSADHILVLGSDIEVATEIDIRRVRFEDLSRGRRRFEFEGSILPPRGEAIEARAVGDACQLPFDCGS